MTLISVGGNWDEYDEWRLVQCLFAVLVVTNGSDFEFEILLLLQELRAGDDSLPALDSDGEGLLRVVVGDVAGSSSFWWSLKLLSLLLAATPLS